MMNGRIWWIATVFFALLVAFFSLQLLKSPEKIAADPVTVDVVVATTNIPLRRSITASELAVRALPAELVPAGAATSIEDVIGKMSTIDLAVNEPVIAEQLNTPNEVTRRLAMSIPDSKGIVALPIKSHLISAGLIKPGDLIDVSATFKIEVDRDQGASETPQTVSLLKELEVHALIMPIDTSTKSPTAKSDEGEGVFTSTESGEQTILMALDSEDALTLQHMIDTDGFLDVMLHSPDNNSLADTQAVDADYLAERYGIRLVREDAFVLTEEYFLNNMEEFVFTGKQYPKPDLSKVNVSAHPGW